MSYRHTHVHNDILTIWVVDDPGQHFERVKEGVALQEAVEHAIPWTELGSSPKEGLQLCSITGDLKLWANTQGGTSCLGLADTFDDAGCVILEIQGPLVEGAG